MSEQHAHGHNHIDRASMSSTPKTGIFLDIREIHSVLEEPLGPQALCMHASTCGQGRQERPTHKGAQQDLSCIKFM